MAVAEHRLRRERAIWNLQTTMLRDRFAKHRGVLAVGSGALAGLLCGFLPLRSMARLGRLCASVAGFALRTPIGGILFDEMRHRASAAEVRPTDHVR